MGTFQKTMTIDILPAIPAFQAEELQIFPVLSAGDPASHRLLEWPNNDIPSIAYDTNPPIINGFDIFPLAGPITDHVRMLEESIVDRSPGFDSDRPVTEVWPASTDGRAVSMRYAFFRSLWNYFANKPPAGQFIKWSPRDRNAASYFIEIISLQPGDINMTRPATEFIEGEVRFTFAVVGVAP